MTIGMIAGLQSSNNDLKLTLSQNFIELDKGEAATITVTSPSNGRIYAISSDTNIVTTSVNNKSITINYIEYGTAIITVGQDYGTGDYASITSSVINIFVTIRIDSILNNNSWSLISYIAKQGLGANYWSAGDTKKIILNGTIGTISLNNFETNVFILHFNLYMGRDKRNSNGPYYNIIFGGFKTNEGKDIALTDLKYNSSNTDGTLYFNLYHYVPTGMSTTIPNYGGWKGTDLRYDILGATSTAPNSTYIQVGREGYDATEDTLNNPKENTLLAALPIDFRQALTLWTRYIATNPYSTPSGMTDYSTVDAITLLSAQETFGTYIGSGNSYENTYHVHMEYYAIGNSTVKYKYDSSSEISAYWFASPYKGGTNNTITSSFCYCYAYNDNNQDLSALDYSNQHVSFGIAPAFKV